jgi:hypothetical protein
LSFFFGVHAAEMNWDLEICLLLEIVENCWLILAHDLLVKLSDLSIQGVNA